MNHQHEVLSRINDSLSRLANYYFSDDEYSEEEEAPSGINVKIRRKQMKLGRLCGL